MVWFWCRHFASEDIAFFPDIGYLAPAIFSWKATAALLSAIDRLALPYNIILNSDKRYYRGSSHIFTSVQEKLPNWKPSLMDLDFEQAISSLTYNFRKLSVCSFYYNEYICSFWLQQQRMANDDEGWLWRSSTITLLISGLKSDTLLKKCGITISKSIVITTKIKEISKPRKKHFKGS